VVSENQEEKTGKKVCQHKAGDRWDDGCCGDDRSAKNSLGEIAVSTNESIAPLSVGSREVKSGN